MAQFVLKIEKLSHIMGPRAAQDLRSRLWLLEKFKNSTGTGYCLDFCLRSRSGKLHNYFEVVAFESLVFKMFSVDTKTQSRCFQISPVWRAVSKNSWLIYWTITILNMKSMNFGAGTRIPGVPRILSFTRPGKCFFFPSDYPLHYLPCYHFWSMLGSK